MSPPRFASPRRSTRAPASTIRGPALLVIVVVAVVAACLPGGQMPGAQMPVGSRQLIITVTNDSLVPVPVEVAPMGLVGTGGGTGQQVGRAHWVGLAQPASVPPGSHPVTFLVPPTHEWAIYANGGELIGPLDVGSRVGVLPIGIVVDRNGQPGWTSPGGWP